MKKEPSILASFTQLTIVTLWAILAVSCSEKDESAKAPATQPEIGSQKTAQAWESAKKEGTIQAYLGFLEANTNSPMNAEAESALGKLLYEKERYADAFKHYSRVSTLRSDDAIARRSMELSKVLSERKLPNLPSEITASLKGKLNLVEGPWGQNYPLKDSLSAKGDTIAKLGTMEFKAKVDGWDFLYSDSSKKQKVGWGAVITDGEVVVFTRGFNPFSNGGHAFTNKPAPFHYFAEESFDVEPFDYFGDYYLLKVSEAKKQRIVVPVFHNGRYASWSQEAIKGQVAQMGPGVYGIAPQVKSAASGIPMKIEFDGRVNVSGKIFRTDDGSHPAGVRIMRDGSKVAFGAEHLVLSLDDTASFTGLVLLDCLD